MTSSVFYFSITVVNFYSQIRTSHHSQTEDTTEEYSSQLFQIWQSNWSWKVSWDIPGVKHREKLFVTFRMFVYLENHHLQHDQTSANPLSRSCGVFSPVVTNVVICLFLADLKSCILVLNKHCKSLQIRQVFKISLPNAGNAIVMIITSGVYSEVGWCKLCLAIFLDNCFDQCQNMKSVLFMLQ